MDHACNGVGAVLAEAWRVINAASLRIAL